MKIKLIILFAICAISFAYSADSPKDFIHSYQIDIPNKNDYGVYKCEITDLFYNNISANYADVRIFDINKHLIPYIIIPVEVFKKVNQEIVHHPRLITLNKLQNNKIELICTLQDNALAPNKLSIKTNIKNYDKTISVYGVFQKLRIFQKTVFHY